MIRVLYVDDEPDLLQIGKLYLEEAGDISITIIDSAQAGLALLKKEQFDAVISDYQMPVMDGIELLKHIRSDIGNIPFIIFTGRGREEIVIEALNSGADFYLQNGGDPLAQFAELRHKILSAIASHRAEDALRENDLLFREVFNNANDSIFLLERTPDGPGKYLLVNDKAVQMLGYSKEEFLEMSPWDIVPEEIAKKIMPSVIKKLLKDGHATFESAHRRKDGSIYPIEVSTHTFRYKGRDVDLSIIRDITERKRTESALTESFTTFRTIMDSLDALVYVADMKTFELLFVNQYGRKIFGDITGKLCWESLQVDQKGPCPFCTNEKLVDVDGNPTGILIWEFKNTITGQWFECHDRAIRWTDGRIVRIEIATDITERKKLEVSLKESENLYRTLFNNTGAASIIIGPDTTILLANDGWVKLTGVPREEQENKKSWTVFIDKDDVERMQQYHYARRNDPTLAPRVYEYKLIDATNTVHHCIAQVSMIPGSNNSVASVVDISSRVQAEKLFQVIFENMGTALIIIEEDTTISHVNAGMEKIWGYKKEEIEGLVKWPTLVVKEDLERMLESHRLRRLNPASAPGSYEFRLIHKSGELRVVDLTAAMVSGTKKSVISLRDITEFKKAVQALKESEEFNRELVENMPDIVIVYGLDRKIRYANPTVTRMLGYLIEELSGTDMLDFVVPEQRSDVGTVIQKRLTSGITESIEVELLKKDGGRLTVISNGSMVHFHGEPAVLLLLTNITDRKTLENQLVTRVEELACLSSSLEQMNRKLNLLSSITRHDINNQLALLMGFLTILKKKQPDPLFNEYFVKISNAAQRISSMIQFTREYEAIGINAPIWQDVRTIVDTATKEAPLGQVMVRNVLPAGAEVFADPLIVKVCYNLMDNAVRYGRKITTIRFTVEDAGEDHLIVCEDDGDGILADEKEMIFDRGFGKNTGLGLAISREILLITGITIKETGEPGKGARFEMTVPKGAYRFADLSSPSPEFPSNPTGIKEVKKEELR